MGYSYPYVYINVLDDSLDNSAYIPQLVNYAPEDVWFDPFEDWYIMLSIRMYIHWTHKMLHCDFKG